MPQRTKNYRTDVMAPGQRVVLWVGGPATATRTPGVWGIGHVTGPAYLRVDADNASDYWLDEERADRLEWAVDLDVDILSTPIAANELRAIPELAGMELFRAPQMSNPIYLSPEEVSAVERRVGPWPEYPGDAPSAIIVGSTGAGFGDPLANHIVERAAMERVMAHYRDLGFAVTDVSDRKCGWNVTCTAPDHGELHVEVKGISGSKAAFLLTANEYTAAADSCWRLAAVTDALGTRPTITVLTGAQVVAGTQPMLYEYRPRAIE
ncbi:protein NO VEIN domain-containing protein [Streptomyces sp. NBC_00996]|uniref:protein NO VEIN domain-containing protein n=1 Tax=Streptomyces sp. NBC_00996 TaxID=2903710 RepID=UPI003863B56D|nr:EVE domain-containing protein [Streptomyces sp. NBC_00996]